MGRKHKVLFSLTAPTTLWPSSSEEISTVEEESRTSDNGKPVPPSPGGPEGEKFSSVFRPKNTFKRDEILYN